VRLLITVSHASSLFAYYKLLPMPLWVSLVDFCFIRRFGVQIIGRQCNSWHVLPIESQSLASSYTLLVNSVLLMRRYKLFLFRIRMSLEFQWPTFIGLMFVPYIISSRNDQHYALICTTTLFCILAPTAGKHNRRNHDNPAHRPRNHTLYDIPPIRFVFQVTQKDLRSSVIMAG
jgi:hypothetical protein